MTALLRKEFAEMTRSYRLLFIPLVFLLLALANLILLKMLPDMLASGAGNIPEGAVIEIPPPTAIEAIQKFVGQLDQFGALVLILAVMGTIAGERASGVMTTILIKPVSRMAYAGSKLIAALALTLLSYALSAGATYLYAGELFDDKLDPGAFWRGSLIYGPKLLFIAVLVLFCSAIFRSAIAAGGVSLAAYMAMSFLSGVKWLQQSPVTLSKTASAAFAGESVQAGAAIAVTFALMAALFAGACWLLSRKET